MENKDVREMAEVLTKSLDDTQKNALNTEKLVQQVCNMSGQENHNQVVAGIIADKDTDWEKKVDLIQKANAEYDQREENNTRRVRDLQSTQTQNVGAATSWWAENWGWVAAAGGLVLIATPGGRKMISSATKYLLTAS
ncbi:hypothetical protein [Chordicoccus furentiruminis]|uniref:hypothetical protein n=1 Tax=Chordicoccus furentiruminis TaxID=2709410 RepID=UPI0023A793E5|nr:hypothetical protein [Chordicoccus furentiruminis]